MIWCMHKPKVGFSPFFVAANALFCSDGFYVVPSFPPTFSPSCITSVSRVPSFTQSKRHMRSKSLSQQVKGRVGTEFSAIGRVSGAEKVSQALRASVVLQEKLGLCRLPGPL